MKGIVWIFVVFALVGAYADIDIKSVKQVKQVKKGLRYVRAQTHKPITKIRLKRYYLGIEASKPFFRSINDDILELYMAAFLQNAHPYWLEDDIFVFHSSSNRKYLNQLKRLYQKRYNIETVVYKNTKYRKGSFKLRSVNYDDIKTYMDEHNSRYFKSKKKKHDKAKSKNRILKKSENGVMKVATTVSRKKEANLVNTALVYIDKHKDESSTRLGRYILYTQAEEPSFFRSMDGIYNLYLTGIVNGGHPKWLEDGRLVLHTAKSMDYLKRLRRLYRKRYGLHLSIAKGSVRKVKLKAIDSDDLKAYLQERIPKKYMKKSVKRKAPKVYNKKRQTKVSKKAALKKEHLRNARKKRLQKQRSLAKAKKRVAAQKKKLRAQKEKLAKKEKEAKRKAKEQKKAIAFSKNKRQKKINSVEMKLLEEKKRALKLERQELEKEKKALAEARKRLAEEKASRERLEKQRTLKKEKEAAEKKQIEKQRALEVEKKRLEEQRRKVEKEKAMKQKLAEKKRAAERKRAKIAKQKAEAKKKKEDALTSELDKMLEETSNFKKKLERSESIKYY